MYNDEKQWQLDFSGILILFLRCFGSFYYNKYWDQCYVKLNSEYVHHHFQVLVF